MNCPDCGAAPYRFSALRPSLPGFGSVDVSVGPYRLATCRDCGLTWKIATFLENPRALNALYSAVPDDHWSGQHRRDYRLAYQVLGTEEPTSVLDVGCFRGDFLAGLPFDADLLGTEFSDAAGRVSVKRGVKLLGSDTNAVASSRAHATTAFDVIEHVESPLKFLSELVRITRPGGLVIIGTGNADHWGWRLRRDDYYYSALPEHRSFLPARWFQEAPQKVSVLLVGHSYYRHGDGGFARWLKQTTTNLIQHYSPTLAARLAALVGRPQLASHPYPWGMSRNHQLAVFRVRP